MAFRGFPARGDAAELGGYSPAAKMKRKDPEVYDDFFEFSLSSPARKIRRLDAELPPIVLEEEKPSVLPGVFAQPVPGRQQLAAGLGEVGSSVACNEERAIVLYNPAVHEPLFDSPSSSSVSLRVDPDVFAGLKNGMFGWGQRKLVQAIEERARAESDDDREAAASRCLAVVPWVQSQTPENMSLMSEPAAPVGLAEVAMESEDLEGVSMDVEEEGGLANATAAAMAPVMSSGGLQPWHWQQMVRPSTPSPIMWSWG